MASSAPNSPADVEADYRGEIRNADGYQYWATSEEDEEQADQFENMASTVTLGSTADEEKDAKKGRSSSVRALVRFGLLLALALLGYFAFSFWQVYDATNIDEAQSADAIVVLGAAQFDGTPSGVFAARLDRAFELREAGHADRIFTTGGNQEGDRVTEGFSGYVYLREKGVPESDLVLITDGVNTWEQLSASTNQLNELELDTVLLVSDGYHNYRLLAIAEELGIEAYVAPTQVDPTIRNYVREATAVSIGRVFGYRRLSALTAD